MTKGRTVFAVCSTVEGWPPEVYALFETREEAKRHLDAAYPVFRIVPLTVYESYDDLPQRDRYTDSAPGEHRFSP